jgi:hypothetical protein
LGFADGSAHLFDVAILTMSLPLLNDITFPPAERESGAAVAHIGFGNVIKILFRFRSRWWPEQRKDLADFVAHRNVDANEPPRHLSEAASQRRSSPRPGGTRSRLRHRR